MKALLKKILLSAVVVSMFFGSLELYHRIKFYVLSKDESYLIYGASYLEIWLSRLFGKEAAEEADIVIFGGSTVLCDGIPRDLAFPQQLERLFEESGRNITVKNMGKGGTSSTDDLKRMRAYLVRHKPKMIILCTGVNDVLFLHGRPRFMDRLHAYLFKHSLLYVSLNDKLSKMFKRKGAVKTIPLKDSLNIMGDLQAKTLKSNLIQFIDAARRFGSAPLLGTVPIDHKDPYFQEELGKLADIIRQTARLYDVPLIDIRATFDSRTDKKDLFLPDGVHTNKFGAAEEARIMYDHLKDLDILGR